jgi:type III pantothenate kinase
MLLAIDAGNTNIVFAVYDGAKRMGLWRCKTETSRTADEYTVFLAQLFPAADLGLDSITDVIISSVVPDANMNLRRLCEKTFGCQARFVGTNDVLVKLKINLNKPEELGADRIVNAVAVLSHHHCPAIVVDFGTATTFDVINGKGEYCGGAIATGVNLSMEALHRAAAKLPKIAVGRPESVIGRDTIGAMQSGVYWGYISMVEGMIARITDELGEKPFVIATGGLSSLFAGGTDKINLIDEELTLRGLVAIHQHNQKAKAA